MSFNVLFNGSGQTYNVKASFSSSPVSKIVTINYGGVQVPSRFRDLADMDETDLQDNGVIMFDAASGTYKIVDPDEVLSVSASSSGPQPGLPSDFLDRLDTDLDNRIDIDGGSF